MIITVLWGSYSHSRNVLSLIITVLWVSSFSLTVLIITELWGSSFSLYSIMRILILVITMSSFSIITVLWGSSFPLSQCPHSHYHTDSEYPRSHYHSTVQYCSDSHYHSIVSILILMITVLWGSSFSLSQYYECPHSYYTHNTVIRIVIMLWWWEWGLRILIILW